MTRKQPKQPDQVKQFVDALKANAYEAFHEPDQEFDISKEIVYAAYKDGIWTICDNYERFFNTIYMYDVKKDVWSVRYMYRSVPPEEYSFEMCMSDASIMFTG